MITIPAQTRIQLLSDLKLLESGNIPIFDEATQIAARFLDAPICVLGLLDQDYEWLKAAVGLSRLGLMNALAASRQISYAQSLSRWIVESGQVLVISDTELDSRSADSLLATQYHIRSYLGVPLVNTAGYCLGTLAVMDLAPRSFTTRDVELLELTARWSMSELERHHLVTQYQQFNSGAIEVVDHQRSIRASANGQSSELSQTNSSHTNGVKCDQAQIINETISSIKISLLTQMTQELRTPLTSVMGMASVLVREIYGPLTAKQKEYLTIVHQSGQYLLSLVSEMIELADLDKHDSSLNLIPVDIEMLCQQVMNMLEQAASRQEVTIRFTIEPGNRIYLLDKNKVRHLLYHLMLEVIQTSAAGGEVRLHSSRKGDRLQITVWVHHPWLGDGLSAAELHHAQSLHDWQTQTNLAITDTLIPTASTGVQSQTQPDSRNTDDLHQLDVDNDPYCSDGTTNLGLRLSQQLAIAHGGDISIQGTTDNGYRYVLSLPYLTENTP